MAHWKRDDFNGFRSEIKRHSGDVYDGGSHASFFVPEMRLIRGWIFKWIFKVDIHLGGNWIFKTGFLGCAIERG